MIRIDEIRALHRDLHMRPYEAERRVYVIADAHLLNEDAADALLKDLEEPPPYAVIVLVADELGPIPPTIRSRCQLVPFRRLPGRVIRELLAERAPGLSENEARALARVSGGRLDRVERLLDPEATVRRDELLRVARSPYAEPELDPADAAASVLDARPPGARRRRRGRARARGGRPDLARARAAAAARPAGRRARGAARLARGARLLVPRPRRRRGRGRVGGRARRPARRCCGPTGPPSARPTPSGGASSSAQAWRRSRSSTSTRAWRWRRSSSSLNGRSAAL